MPVQRFNPKVSMVGRSGITPLSKSLRMSVRDKYGNTMTKKQFEAFVRSDPKLKVLARKNGTVESWVGAKHTGAFFKKVHEEGGKFIIKPKVKEEVVYKGKVSDRAVKNFYLGVKKEEVAAKTPQGPTPEEKMKAMKLARIKEGWKKIHQYERADEIRKQPKLGEMGASTSAAEIQRQKQEAKENPQKGVQPHQPVSAPMPFAGTALHTQSRPAGTPTLPPSITTAPEQGVRPAAQPEDQSALDPAPQKGVVEPQNDGPDNAPPSAPISDPDIG